MHYTDFVEYSNFALKCALGIAHPKNFHILVRTRLVWNDYLG